MQIHTRQRVFFFYGKCIYSRYRDETDGIKNYSPKSRLYLY